MRKRIYLGCKHGEREIFLSEKTPTQESHPQFFAAIGPFRTRRAAEFMKQTGLNPHCQCVADAERISKQEKR